MEIIVSHDHSDFDAVAAQLAVHKLMPTALPVLTRRQNRSVRQFLALYRDELPFTEQKHLKRGRVDHVIMVDTTSIPTIRGTSDDTRYTVIDHHAAPESINPDWAVTIEPVGAATTILVERLRRDHVTLAPIEATLMLLGIYEDTGALTYGTTTHRDAYAAAWLIEQGANLDIVRNFLFAPLSESQRTLYEKLLESAQTHTIENHTVLIAAASDTEIQDEIAIVAHKLRDVMEVDAVFMLVDLGTHVQIVARSSTESIDVSTVAGHFGGGGHNRAAAAMVRDTPLNRVVDQLTDMLPDVIKPGITVADLMSHGVKVLKPDVRVRDASRQMRRYGYEGFPVVQDNHLIGLLTRRAVDRTIDHSMDGLRVGQVMEAGTWTVAPSDSLSRLQHIMMNSGWGQIPVVDDDDVIIGVVTRTDLVRHLGHLEQPALSGKSRIIQMLEDALPPVMMTLVHAVSSASDDLGYSPFVVGGFVRDLLLGQPTTDIDFVIEGDAIHVASRMQRRYGGSIRSHERFGTAKWLLDHDTWQTIAEHDTLLEAALLALPQHIDFATARTEFYEGPTMLPDVERSSIKLDLHRRDFTINTLAISLGSESFGALRDYYSGVSDLNNGIIRVLHSLSFVDDPTRILRAVRFEQRFGFQIDPRTQELIQDALPLINRLSGDRVRHEINLILAERSPELIFRRLERLGVLSAIHPSLAFRHWHESAFRALHYALEQPPWPGLDPHMDPAVPYFGLLTYDLPHVTIHEVCDTLRVKRGTVEQVDRIQLAREHLDDLGTPLRPSEIFDLLHGFEDSVLLTAWAAASSACARRQIAEYAGTLRHIAPYTDGNFLIKAGLKPGPIFAAILTRLRQAWLDGEISSKDEEQHLLDLLIAENRPK